MQNDTPALTIGELGKTTGTKVPTIRYYEQIGLMPEPLRSAGNQRRYTAAHAERLGFIRHARDLGFSLEAIRDLLGFTDRPDETCEKVDEIARRHLTDVRRRIASLQALEGELERMAETCKGGQVANCRVIEVLSGHAKRSVQRH